MGRMYRIGKVRDMTANNQYDTCSKLDALNSVVRRRDVERQGSENVKIVAFEMLYSRRMLGIPQMSRRTNASVVKEVEIPTQVSPIFLTRTYCNRTTTCINLIHEERLVMSWMSTITPSVVTN